MASSEKLLNVEPHDQLSFRLELMKRASCTVRLSSNSRRHVAFKIMNTSPENYAVRPNSGILLPGSTCEVQVTMRAPEEVFPNMECNDKFLIKSVLASRDDTVERTKKLFNTRGPVVGDHKLRVVYVFPSYRQSSNYDRSGRGASLNGSILQERRLRDTQFQEKIERLFDNMFVKGIIVLFLSWMLLHLILMILPVLWSWTIVATFLIIKMAMRLVSDSVEDWVVKALVYVCVHFFTVLFRRQGNRSSHESGVSVAR